MKMRKILSGVIAAALAASTMIVSASAATTTVAVYDSQGWKNIKATGSFNFMENTFAVGDSMTFKIPAIVKVNTDGGGWEWLELHTQKNSATIGGVSASGNVIDGIKVNFGLSNKGGAEPTLAAGKRSSIPFTVELGWVADGGDGALKNDNYGWAIDAVANFANTGVDGSLPFATLAFDNVTIGTSDREDTKQIIDCQYDSFSTVSKNATGTLVFDGSVRYTMKEAAAIASATRVTLRVTLSGSNNTSGNAVPYLSASINGIPNYAALVEVTKDKSIIDFDITKDIYDADYGVAYNSFKVDAQSTNKDWNKTNIIKVELVVDDGTAAPAGDEATTDETTEDGAEEAPADEDDIVNGDDDEYVDEEGTDDEFVDDEDDFGSDDSANGDNSNDGATDDASTAGAGSTSTPTNPKTGVAVAVIPAIVAAAAVVVARKRK